MNKEGKRGTNKEKDSYMGKRKRTNERKRKKNRKRERNIKGKRKGTE